MARSVVTWTEDQAAFASSKSAGLIGHAATDPQTEAAHMLVWSGHLPKIKGSKPKYFENI